jgi:hypothetical protein
MPLPVIYTEGFWTNASKIIYLLLFKSPNNRQYMYIYHELKNLRLHNVNHRRCVTKVHSSRSGFSRPQSLFAFHPLQKIKANSDVLWKEGAVIDARKTLKSGSSLT